MKVVVIALAILVGTIESLKCIKSLDGSGAAQQCGETDKVCSRPTFIEFTGISAGTFACGACKGDTKTQKKCEECSTTGCNKPYEVGADFKCHDYKVSEDDKKVVTIAKEAQPITCKRLKTTTDVKCNMPTTTSTKAKYTSVSGCGPCVKAQKDAGTCKECDGAECNVMTPIKCVQSTQGAATIATASVCQLAATTCFKPKFTDYIGFANGINYGCGACPKDSATKCETCQGKTDEGCNKLDKTKFGADFKCHTWTMEVATNKYKTVETTCKRKKDTAIVCNMPDDGATKTTYTSKSGCGPCNPGEKNKAKGCKECTTENCNKKADAAKDGSKGKGSSSSPIKALLIPFLAIIYLFY